MKQILTIFTGVIGAALVILVIEKLLIPTAAANFSDMLLHYEGGALFFFLVGITADKALKVYRVGAEITRAIQRGEATPSEHSDYTGAFVLLFLAVIVSATVYIGITSLLRML